MQTVPMLTAERSGSCAFLLAIVLHPGVFLRSLNARHASERSVLLLFMQSLDNSLTSYRRRGRLLTKQGTGEPNPTWIPIAHDIAKRFANKIDGDTHAYSPTRSTSRPRRTTSAAVSSAHRPRRASSTLTKRVFGYPDLQHRGPARRLPPTWA